MRAAEEEDFREFMQSRWPQLVRLAFGLTGDRGHAEDLAQTALAKAYAAWPKVSRAADPDPYVRRILVNSHNRRFRKRRVGEADGSQLPEIPLPDPAGDLAESAGVRTDLLAALGQLPPRQRAVVVLRYWFDLTETQAAEVLQCSVGNVKSQSSRALAKLREDARLVEGGLR